MPRMHRWSWDRDASDFSVSSYNQPQYTILPSDGVAANGKPILDWDGAATQITRDWPNVGWNTTLGTSLTISYAFRATAPAQMPEDTSGFSPFSAAQITATVTALQYWAETANITFQRILGPGNTGYSNNATI